jgi:hypothetical protein
MLLQLHVNGQDNVQAYAKAIRLQLEAMQAAHRGHDVRSLTLQAHPPYADLGPIRCERGRRLARC